MSISMRESSVFTDPLLSFLSTSNGILNYLALEPEKFVDVSSKYFCIHATRLVLGLEA